MRELPEHARLNVALGRAGSRWQERDNFDVTGMLTTFQRSELVRQYNLVGEGLDLKVITDKSAGISMVVF